MMSVMVEEDLFVCFFARCDDDHFERSSSQDQGYFNRWLLGSGMICIGDNTLNLNSDLDMEIYLSFFKQNAVWKYHC